MDLSPEERQALDDLREVARRYCAEIEAVSQRTAIEFLRRMNHLLPELYWRASLLPVESFESDEDEVEEDGGEDGDDQLSEAEVAKLKLPTLDDLALKEHTRRHFAIAREVESVLGTLDHYQFVFYPFDDTEPPVSASLSHDLAEIYMDFIKGFDEDQPRDRLEQLWHWRWAYQWHWGIYHLPPTLHAVSWLVHQYWDQWDETWDDEFLSRRNPGQT
jgi:hypothetical protein